MNKTNNPDEAVQSIASITIVPVVVRCPSCDTVHVDEGEWEMRPHRTHLCLSCGILFDVVVRGVAALQLDDETGLKADSHKCMACGMGHAACCGSCKTHCYKCKKPLNKAHDADACHQAYVGGKEA